ncbi:MAG: hypothetical protein IJI11_00705 [Mogibacterium sp.]|nr:hypothetical protein [Mogibacterium sp.]
MKGVNTKYYINVVIGLAFMFLFPLIGPAGPITAVGMKILGIFIGMVWLWITADAMWPSLLALVLVGLSGYVPDAEGYAGVKAVLASSFGSDTLLNITFITLLFAAVSALGLTEHIVNFFMKRKALEGKPYLMLFLFMLSAYTVGGTTDPIVSIFILWPAVSEMCAKYGYKKTSLTHSIMIMSIFLGSILGQPMLAFKGMTAALFGTLTSITGITINLAVYLVFNICMAVVVIIIYLLMVRFIFKPDFTGLRSVKVEDIVKNDTPMTKPQKLIGILLIMLIAGILLPNIVPATVPGIKILQNYGVLGIEAVLMAIAMIARDKEGNMMIDVREISKNGFSWNIFFQCAAAIYMAGALTGDATGIKDLLVGALTPILGGLPGIVFVIIVIVCALVLTNIFNNMIVGVIMLTVSMPFMGTITGVNFASLATLTVMSVCVAALLPSGSIYCSYLHSNREYIDFKSIYKVFVPTIIVVAIVYACIGYPIASMLFK